MKLEINYKKKMVKEQTHGGYTHTLKTIGDRMKSKRKSESPSRQNANGNTIFQNLLDATKAVLREKLVPIQAFLKKQEKFCIKHFIT